MQMKRKLYQEIKVHKDLQSRMNLITSKTF